MSDTAGGSKPQEAAQDAASAVTSAVPDAPKEAPKDIPNPLQNFFGKRGSAFLRESYLPADQRQPHGRSGFNNVLLRDSKDEMHYALSLKGIKIPVRIHQTIQRVTLQAAASHRRLRRMQHQQ